jgi:hypothetical protein
MELGLAVAYQGAGEENRVGGRGRVAPSSRGLCSQKLTTYPYTGTPLSLFLSLSLSALILWGPIFLSFSLALGSRFCIRLFACSLV